MRALITGASGFAGRHLTRHLREAGDDVTGTDRRHGGPDLLDAAAWVELVRAAAPEVVYHLAAQASVPASWSDPATTVAVNVVGTQHVLDACRAAGVDRVVVVSSSDVYGKVRPDQLPLREDAPLRPVSPYAASKAAAEQVALQAWSGFGLAVVRVRPFNHLGPGQDDRFVAGALAARVAEAEAAGGSGEVTVGNLTARRDFTDVRDVVRAYRALAVAGEPGEVYHVCSGRATAISDLADGLLARAGRPLRLRPDPDLLRPSDVPELVGDAAKLREATGWTPAHGLDTTLDDLLADARRRLPH
jgi:GDP-4-dehydro-6-deoxy-D-mannose reductase